MHSIEVLMYDCIATCPTLSLSLRFARSFVLFDSEMKSWDRFAILMPFAIFIFAEQQKIEKLALSKRCVDIDSRKLNLKCSLRWTSASTYRNVKPVFFHSTSNVHLCVCCRLKMLLHSSFVINHRLKYRLASNTTHKPLHKYDFSIETNCFLINECPCSFNGECCVCIDIDNIFIERIDNFDLLFAVDSIRLETRV